MFSSPTRCPFCHKMGKPRRRPVWATRQMAHWVLVYGVSFLLWFPLIGLLDKRCPHCGGFVAVR